MVQEKTLMRMIAGLLKPDAGKISVMGLDPIDDSIAMRAGLDYMPQNLVYMKT